LGRTDGHHRLLQALPSSIRVGNAKRRSGTGAIVHGSSSGPPEKKSPDSNGPQEWTLCVFIDQGTAQEEKELREWIHFKATEGHRFQVERVEANRREIYSEALHIIRSQEDEH
jgi:hypothetical protein